MRSPGCLFFLVLPLLLALAPLAADTDSDLPVLRIVSKLGEKEPVRIFNDEDVVFYARGGVRIGGRPLRGVTFVLYDEGGRHTRTEDVRTRSSDRATWGRPPSSFAFPLPVVRLPEGRYRLRAEKPGYQPAEVKIVYARFSYCALETDHTDEHYLAGFRIRLVDVTEKRSAVPVKVRIETASGGLLDLLETELVRSGARKHVFESPRKVRLSSRAEKPDRRRAPAERTGVLKVVLGCRMVLELGGIGFGHPVPLPPERATGRGGPGLSRSNAPDWAPPRSHRSSSR